MSEILSWLEYWLVNHPTIKDFSWTPGHTLGSSPHFMFITVLSYLFCTFTLSRIIPFPSISILKPISAVHSMSLLLLSFTMALGSLLSTLSHAPHIHCIICIPPNTPSTGPLFFWTYIFYLSKILEFVDTLLIILGNSIQRLTFLHVYHHSTVVVMCYISLQTSQTMFPAVIVTNASVHVLMYAYYLSCALGVRPKWKKLVTNCQIMQFCSSFVVLGPMLYYHFTDEEAVYDRCILYSWPLMCSKSGSVPGSGVWGWTFNVVFNASLLVLFLDFHKKNYGAGSSTASSNKIHVNNVKPSKSLFSSTHHIHIHK